MAYVGPAGPWDDLPHGDYVSTVCQYLSAAADHLDGFGAACLAGAALFPPATLSRAAFEFAVQAVWLLDPRCDWRHRAAREHLELLLGIEEQIKGTPKVLPDGTSNASRAELKRFRREFREVTIPGLFDSVVVDQSQPDSKEARHTIVEDERLLSPTAAAEHYEMLTFGEVVGFYDALSALCHPNPLMTRRSARDVSDRGPDQPRGRRFEASVESTERALQMTMQALMKAEFTWAAYSGWVDAPLRQWEDEIEAVLPGSYNPSK
jgi:hypothetical protein